MFLLRPVPNTFLQKQDPASPHQHELVGGLAHVLTLCLPVTCSLWSTQHFPGGEGERENLHLVSLPEEALHIGPCLCILSPQSPQLAAGTAQQGAQAEIYKGALGTAAPGSLHSIHLPGCLAIHLGELVNPCK